MTYADLYQILIEAEDRAANHADADVRARSAETVALVNERMARDGLTRQDLVSQ